MDMTAKTLQPIETRDIAVECPTESQRQDYSASNTYYQTNPDVYECTIYDDYDRPEYDDVDDVEMPEVEWCDKDPKEEEYYDSEKMANVWKKYNEMKLDDGSPVSKKLGLFMETSLQSQLPKKVMLLTYDFVRNTDLNLPTAEEFFTDLKNAGFTYPTWFTGE